MRGIAAYRLPTEHGTTPDIFVLPKPPEFTGASDYLASRIAGGAG
jgi:hypothetical protein